MQRDPESKKVMGQTADNLFANALREEHYLQTSRQAYHNLEASAVVKSWKGKGHSPTLKELKPEIVAFEGDVAFEGGDLSSFFGASHPPKPVDTDLMRSVYVTIDQNKLDAGCLMKEKSGKGPYMEDLSIRVSSVKPDVALVSPAESMADESNELSGALSPFSVASTSQATKIVYSGFVPLKTTIVHCGSSFNPYSCFHCHD